MWLRLGERCQRASGLTIVVRRPPDGRRMGRRPLVGRGRPRRTHGVIGIVVAVALRIADCVGTPLGVDAKEEVYVTAQ